MRMRRVRSLHPEDGAVYFTDPFYGFLESHRLPLGDHTYTSDKSALGFAGVYRVPAPSRVGAADLARPELLVADLARPNGIDFEPSAAVAGMHAMWVSECCQGHAPTCPAATARWHKYVPLDAARSNFTRERTIEWVRPGGGGGCADGFKVLARPGRSSLLVAACPLGVCVVDTASSTDAPSSPLIERVDFGHRVSNVAVGGDGNLYVTGEGHLWRLALSPAALAPLGPTPEAEHWSESVRDEL
jgi:hypothetical protein